MSVAWLRPNIFPGGYVMRFPETLPPEFEKSLVPKLHKSGMFIARGSDDSFKLPQERHLPHAAIFGVATATNHIAQWHINAGKCLSQSRQIPEVLTFPPEPALRAYPTTPHSRLASRCPRHKPAHCPSPRCVTTANFRERKPRKSYSRPTNQ